MKHDFIRRIFRASIVLLVLGAVAFGAELLRANSGGKWIAPVGANSKKNPLAGDASSIQVGKKIFVKECVQCHGKKGVGDGPKAADLPHPPGNLSTHDFQSQTDGAIFWKITQGNKPMPSFKDAYSELERWSIVNYVRTLGR